MTRCVKYWAKLTSLPNYRYQKQIYIMLRRPDKAWRTTWASHVKILLFRYGFGYAWLAVEIGDVSAFVELFKTRVKDCALQNLTEKLNTSSKTVYYRLYLSIDLPYLYKRALSNFRCSGHNFNIETGRHLHIDRVLRFCDYCRTLDIQIVEDQLYVLLVCALYYELRQALFPDAWLNRPICDELVYRIMQTKDDKHIYLLLVYI